MPPLTSPFVTLVPRLPSSPTVISTSALFILHSLFSHIQTCNGLSLVCCPSAWPYQKGWPPLIWRSLIILCRTGGPLIQPLLPLASPSRPQHSPVPLSPMVLSSFSGCNCSTINRGGRRIGWVWSRRKGMKTEWKTRGQNVISLLHFIGAFNVKKFSHRSLEWHTKWLW